jgi:hypothetical protein
MSVEEGAGAGVAGVGSVIGGGGDGGGISMGLESGFSCFWKTDSMGESSCKEGVKGMKKVQRG